MISLRDIKFLETVKQMAQDNVECKRQHAAILTKGNTILSSGKNNRRTQMKNYKFGHLECHAELDAIMRAPKQCLLRG